MAPTTDQLTAARAEALFASTLPAGSRPSPAEVVEAIQLAVRVHAGVRGCAAEVAAAYGERPETAVLRMRWALAVVMSVYPPVRPGDRWPASFVARATRAVGAAGAAPAAQAA